MAPLLCGEIPDVIMFTEMHDAQIDNSVDEPPREPT